MCATCGCSHGDLRLEGAAMAPVFELTTPVVNAEVANAGQRLELNGHASHAPGVSQERIIQIEMDILSKNKSLADVNREGFVAKSIFATNIVSSPGSGKTTLLVRTIEDLKGEMPVAVIEGDQETANDAERIRATGVQAIQINTGRGCHLDAHMVAQAVKKLNPAPKSLLFVENVGNLVCPASFDLGEGARIVVISVTEGEDKPIKYPDMFASADIVVVNKIDLLPYLRFDVDKLTENIAKINRRARVMKVSATTGEGLGEFYDWLRASLARAAA